MKADVGIGADNACVWASLALDYAVNKNFFGKNKALEKDVSENVNCACE